MTDKTTTIIEKFKNYLSENNLKSFSVSDWKEIFSKELSGIFLTTSYSINPKWLYRARLNFDSTGLPIDYFTHVKDLWAPPHKKVKRQGRCNSIGQSLLYCSSNPTTTLFEMRPNTDEEMTIIDYEVLRSIELLGVIGVHDIVKIGDDFKNIFQKHFVNSPEESNLLDNILSSIFQTKQTNSTQYPIYNLTNAIMQIFINSQKAKGFPKHLIAPKMIGLIYPSVETAHTLGANIFMLPNEVKGKLVPRNAYKFKILNRIDEHHYKYIQTHESEKIFPNGEIKWRQKMHQEIEYVTDLPT